MKASGEEHASVGCTEVIGPSESPKTLPSWSTQDRVKGGSPAAKSLEFERITCQKTDQKSSSHGSYQIAYGQIMASITNRGGRWRGSQVIRILMEFEGSLGAVLALP